MPPPPGRLAVALLLVAAAPARADLLAAPLLIDASLGFGFEPHARASAMCSHVTTASGGAAMTVSNPQCNLVLAYGVGAEALWRGFIGGAVGLYAAEGSPVQVTDAPSFGDRISATIAFAVRPFAPLARRHGDGFGWRLLAGVGLQVGLAIEHARTSLDQQTTAGFHGEAHLDVPLWGANTGGGLAVRLAARLLVSQDAQLAPVADKSDPTKVTYQVDEPGTAAQLMIGLAWYL